MNINDQSYRVRGKRINIQELVDLSAVRSEKAEGRSTLPVKELENLAPEAALPHLRAFEDAGWLFLPRSQATEGAKVYLKSGGRVALGTNRLTVRVAGPRSDVEAQDVLVRQGVTIVDQLKFAPNLFVVAVPAGQDAVETAERLTASEEIEFAEPEMIEIISGR